MSYFYNVLLGVPASSSLLGSTYLEGGIFTYSTCNKIEIGSRVRVKLGARSLIGIIYSEATEPAFKCRDIESCFDEPPLFPKVYLNFLERLSNHYASPIGLTLYGVLSEKLLKTEAKYSYEREEVEKKDITLTKKQEAILNSIDISKYSCHLIDGITGCGKTEIYQALAKKVIDSGKQVLYIVPEISLTPQLIARLSSRLGFKPNVFHHKLTEKKRRDSFFSFSYGSAPFMIGARSALFVPSKNLGIIIVDEEHESTYKQEEAPSYQTRDMAVLYGYLLNIPVILGSATPSVESINNAYTNKYILHELKERPANATLPKIEVIDIKSHDLIAGIISEPIYKRLYETVEKNEQAIILLNRKGYSTSLYCTECGKILECLDCSVPITYFKSSNKCICRYCSNEYEEIICPECKNTFFKDYGIGTEKVEEFLESMFGNKVIRVDSTNAKSIKTLEENIKRFERKEANILVGTQIVAKGLHFPHVTFVGVLGIDNILSLPDFRATERAYQLLVQVAGRAGRDMLKGRVMIQTYNPTSPVFTFLNDTTNGFYKYELARRKVANFPPFIRIARLTLSGVNEELVCKTSKEISDNLSKENSPSIKVYAALPAELHKIKNRYRYNIIIKSKNNNEINRLIMQALTIFNRMKVGSMQLKVDKDPYYTA